MLVETVMKVMENVDMKDVNLLVIVKKIGMNTVKITLTIANLEPVTYVNVILYLLAPRQMKIIAIVQHAKHNSPVMMK